MSKSLSLSVGAEEVVEHSGVHWHHSLLLEVVVVGIDFGALQVMGCVDHSIDQTSIVMGEFSKRSLLVFCADDVIRAYKSIELLSLVSVSVVL